ncbi:MAG: FAD:protein FMN transferase [Deltaproteobacteria bacterium]|nr:FAD:protein FMN transferase [Deltaproteobacteria bacterium]
MNRRSFIKLSGLLVAGTASMGILSVASHGCGFRKNLHRVSETRMAMGTFVTMTLMHTSQDEAEETIDRVFKEIDRLADLMDRFDESTPVARLNREGVIEDAPPEMIEVISGGLYHHQLTGGSFDISVKPVVDLFEKKMDHGKEVLPMERELKEALALVDSHQIELEGRSVRFKKPGMGITLDGIAKGYAVDRASEMIASLGIKDHLINAGGDIRTMGSKGGQRPWAVAIQDPQKGKDYPDIVHMNEGAIATSGDYENFYDWDRRFHHIVNPKTGLSPEQTSSVSVMGPKTMDADALATAVLVMGPDQGIRFSDSLPQYESLIITKDGSQLKSKGWRSAAK